MSPPWLHVACSASLHFFSSLIITAAVISTTGGTAATENPDSPLTYWLSHSSKIRPGMPLAVSVYLSNTTGTVTLRVELVDRQGKQLQDGQEFVLHGAGETQTIYFNISRSAAVERQRGPPYLRVRSEGGVAFDRVHRMMWGTKILSLFVQTDRAAYSPGQTVRFRALALHDGLQVMHQPMDIEIRDPDNRLISKWSGVRSDDETGVVEGDMTTSSHPPLGTWTIAVTVNDITEIKTFQLQDYDIPDFEVRLSLDRNYALVTDRAISGEITANFISGAPVVGIGTISAEMTKFPTIKHTLQKSFLLDLNGKAGFTFSIDELRDLNRQTYLKRFPFFLKSWAALDYKTFRFTVSIPNGASGDVITDATSLKFYSILPLNVRFLPYSRESFKPGLPYDAYVEALRPNGLPADNSRGTSVNFVVTYRRRRVAQDGPSAEAIYSHSGGVSGGSVAGDVEYPLLEQDVTLDSEGVARLSIPSVPESAQRLRIYAKVGRSNTVFYATRFVSPSDTFLQLSLIKHQRPKVGQPLKFVAACNKPFSTFTYQVYSKGLLLLTNTVDKYQAYRKRFLFSFNVTSSMTPTSDVIAFFKADDGEVIADRLAVGVPDVIENDVKLYLRHHEVEPGRRVKLMIKAAPHSTVFLLGQHKRLAADDGHDITLNDVMSELTRYGSGDYVLRQKTWFFTSPVHSAHDVFKTVQVGFIADGVVPGVEDNEVPSALHSKSGLPSERDSDRMLKKFLPDTWFWNTVRMRGSNSSILTVKAPDTMADWVITAFAVHPTMGLSVARTPEELKDTKKLFITAELPDSAVLGEDVCFTVLAYNLLQDPVEAWITLKKNASGFQNVLVSQDVKEPSVVTQAYKSVRAKTGLGTLKGKSLGAAQFCIKPTVPGHLPLKVVLRTGRRPDVLHKHIVIQSEGVLRRQWRPVLIQMDGPRPRFSQTVNIDVPRDVVPGTLTLSVGVVGDPMGLVADHLGDVLHTSHVNGEQNVITLAASVYLVSYLRHTGQLTPAVLARARYFMLTGYQTQLSYRRQDGSFSMFGKEDPSGNVWLTAFVIKCLVQAASLGNDGITIDPAVISTAVQWMTKQQKRNGGFWDHGGHVGGKLKDVRLAAFVTIALKELELNFFDNLSTSVQAKVSKALSKSVRYLESQLRRLRRDPYSVCIVAHALTLTGSKAARRVQNDLEKRVIVEGDLMHWSGSRKRKQTNAPYPWYRHADPHDIEMTSYALMTLTQKRSVTTEVTSQILTILTRKRARPDAGSVARWLNMQRGPFGGFVSTRDTVIALEALSRMTDMSSANMFSPADVEVSWTSDGIQTSSVTIDHDNHLTLQSVNVLLQDGYQPLEVTISANSSGTSKTSVFAQVLVEYHTSTNTRERVFSAKPTVSNNTATSFVLTTCVRRTSDVIAQAMVLTEIGIPSGYDVIRTASDYGSASHVEFVEGKVVLYYASLKKEESCSVLTMTMTRGVVALSRPIPVTVYDHSNPDKEVTTFYTIQQFGVCDLQHGYMSCPTSA